ncbi:unnamed protein product [Sphagnum balticum]
MPDSASPISPAPTEKYGTPQLLNVSVPLEPSGTEISASSAVKAKPIRPMWAASVPMVPSMMAVSARRCKRTSARRFPALHGMETPASAIPVIQSSDCSVSAKDWLSAPITAVDAITNLTPPGSTVFASAIADLLTLKGNALPILSYPHLLPTFPQVLPAT